MNRIWAWLALVVILLVIGGAYLISVTPFRADQERAVRSVVEGFGKELQDVSLLALRESVADAMQTNYSHYVVPELLTEWLNDPPNAPGRLTSSPWPDRIEITTIQKESNARYVVEGFVIEVTNEGGGIDETPTEAVRRPIVLGVEKRGSDWMIVMVKLGVYPGDGNWIYSEPNAQGIQFQYPQQLPTTYISAQEWPPQVSLTAGEYSCAERDERMVGDREYCVVSSTEEAAGSVYRSYDYATDQGDPIREPTASNGTGLLAHVTFTLRFLQCMNYDEAQQEDCVREQAQFDVDGIVDRIASSIRMQ